MKRVASPGGHLARRRLLALLTIEVVVWVGLSLLTVAVAAGTLASEFPARSASLFGEGVILSICVALATWAFHHRRRVDDGTATRGVVLRGAVTVASVALLGPVLLFALLVAAAGYTA